MTEAEARAVLRAFHAVGDIEQWLAEQPWERLPGGGGWRVRGLQSWRLLLEPVPGDGVRVIMSGAGEPPARWVASKAAGVTTARRQTLVHQSLIVLRRPR
jgi:hypothetical protein